MKFSSASTVSVRVIPRCLIFSGRKVILYSSTSPPITDTEDTPPMARMRGRIFLSDIERSSPGEIVSEVKPTISISPRIDDCGPSVGIPAPGGNTDWRAGSFSATACRAAATSVSQSNSTHTTEKPVADELLTRLTPAAPLSDVSTGNVTNCSTSSGAMPGASVMTTTVGAFRSGKMSTSVLNIATIPAIMIIALRATIRMRLSRENLIIRSKGRYVIKN